MTPKFEIGEEVLCKFHGEEIPGIILDIRSMEARRKDRTYTKSLIYTVQHEIAGRPVVDSYAENYIEGSLNLTMA